MLTKEDFQKKITEGFSILDGATGSNLRNAGMPKGCCAEAWILENPGILQQLQREYAEAGSQILFAPTFQAQPIALQQVGLAEKTEHINEKLVSLTRSVCGNALVAGDLTTVGRPDVPYEELLRIYSRQAAALAAATSSFVLKSTSATRTRGVAAARR